MIVVVVVAETTAVKFFDMGHVCEHDDVRATGVPDMKLLPGQAAQGSAREVTSLKWPLLLLGA